MVGLVVVEVQMPELEVLQPKEIRVVEPDTEMTVVRGLLLEITQVEEVEVLMQQVLIPL